MPSYLPILLTFLAAAFMVGAALGLSALISPRTRMTEEKQMPFECGNRPFEEPGKRFPVHFYTVAILFIVFDIEVVFLYPWAAAFGELGKYGFFAAMFFVAVLFFGLVYEWARGGLEWH
ncbi:MAG: NADH-quinone oxidoreductase subunit A [Candidatus Glassbacteria bacterium]|nr:NADH-quinone oxidoreductase subunit A [Candidatus Glassbacteria bacterium]